MFDNSKQFRKDVSRAAKIWWGVCRDEARELLKTVRIRMLPTVETWEEMGFIEVEKLEDVNPIGYVPIGMRDDSYVSPKIQGVICPIPKEMLPDPKTLTSYYNCIQSHWQTKTEKWRNDEVSQRLIFDRAFLEVSDGELPDELVAIENMLVRTFERALDVPIRSTVFQINSNHHRSPGKHEPAGVASIDGATTIMFRVNAEGKLTGKKSLPPHSIGIYLGFHAAPNSSEPRMNILTHTRF